MNNKTTGRRPWLRLDATVFQNATVRIAECGAIWPWILCQLKLNGGACTALQLHPKLAANDLGIPREIAERQRIAAEENGLISAGADGLYRSRNWDKYQPDSRPWSGDRKKATKRVARKAPDASTVHDSQGTPEVSQSLPSPPRADGDGDGNKKTTTRTVGGSRDRDPGGGESFGITSPGDGLPDAESILGPMTRIVDGVEHYTDRGARSVLIPAWPNEFWDQPNLHRFCIEIANEFPKQVVDAALKMKGIRQLHRPFALKRYCQEAASKAGAKARITTTGDSLLKQAQLEQLAELAADPELLDELIEDCRVAVERPSPEIRELIRERLTARGGVVDILFAEEPHNG